MQQKYNELYGILLLMLCFLLRSSWCYYCRSCWMPWHCWARQDKTSLLNWWSGIASSSSRLQPERQRELMQRCMLHANLNWLFLALFANIAVATAVVVFVVVAAVVGGGDDTSSGGIAVDVSLQLLLPLTLLCCCCCCCRCCKCCYCC